MKVFVFDNQLESAILALRKKCSKENIFADFEKHRFYDKPSIAKNKKTLKARVRRLKAKRRLGSF